MSRVNAPRLHVLRPVQHVVHKLPELLGLVRSVDYHTDALFPARDGRVRHRPARVSELAEVRGKRERVLSEDGEDWAGDAVGEVLGRVPRPEREEVMRHILERLLEKVMELLRNAAQAFAGLWRRRRRRSQSRAVRLRYGEAKNMMMPAWSPARLPMWSNEASRMQTDAPGIDAVKMNARP